MKTMKRKYSEIEEVHDNLKCEEYCKICLEYKCCKYVRIM
jgi:hypothetical protein